MTHKCRRALTIIGIVTYIAFYHYVSIFNFGFEAFSIVGDGKGGYNISLTGSPFNDAYRYVDWLLTKLLLRFELSS